ncbi:MAG: S8 family serine peptidase, partial [Pirellulales bacterium]|nr:S8 family serine peptidase [Pirellulales bacterium]
MPNRQPSRLNSLFGIRAKKERRPAGVSRRRKKQFGFEMLESRQVMSATSLAAPPTLFDAAATSVSSDTAAGQLEILAREIYWQSLIAGSNLAASATTLSFTPPNDPLFNDQWHLLNSGQQVGNPDFQDIFGVAGEDINVAGAWALGYTGAGVTVAVIDSGVQLNHPDLAANINLALALDTITTSGNGNPVFINPGAYHGTAVAGLIGAIANNGIGGSGVAPGVTLVPIRSIDPTAQGAGDPNVIVDAFRRAIQEVDITNNSWGRGGGGGRSLFGMSPDELLAIRDSVIFGRGGLGVIHVFASGNGAGNTFNPGFSDIGNNSSAAYGVANNRYVINVGAVDHDGGYNNFDGSVTNYMEAGPNVLVVAPTGSFAFIDIANDTGLGSGIVTTDLTGEAGANLAPDPITGQEFDRDYIEDTDYTSRMNGTSAAAPLVSGVIALMLEANPNLSWRDVQEILVRSARQNAQFEVPTNGAGQSSQNIWIVNQVPIFHDPDRFFANIPVDPFLRTLSPLLDPNALRTLIGGSGAFTDVPLSSDHHVATPFELTNGAGYTVSQGHGVYNEQIGFGHGVIDAEMAVQLALQWSTKGQMLAPERTFTTFVNFPGGGTVLNLPHAERTNQAAGFQIIPGGIGGLGGFAERWNEYFAPVPDFTKAFSPRGSEFIEFAVPDTNAMSIESVDVKVAITGDAAEALDHLRIMLVSPSGTHSELNHFWVDNYTRPFQLQMDGLTETFNYVGDPGSSAPTSGEFIWTFNTNRSWGERSDSAIVYDPVTGEPVVREFPGGEGVTLGQALTQGWKIVIENWDSGDDFGLSGAEIAWHGSRIAANSERVQGFIGLDDNRDGLFNYSRVITTIGDNDNDPTTIRLGDVVNEVDLTQESFARNITVTATRVSDGVVVDQFVTGHDGNFYFDLVPDEYIISIVDPEGRLKMEDSLTVNGVLDKYKTEWHIGLDHFKAWDHVNGSPGDVVVDAEGVPVTWLDANGDELVAGMKGINFLLDPGAVASPEATLSGTVYADFNGDGAFNGADTVLPNIGVFGDVNRNGSFDAGEVLVETDASGNFALVVPGIASAAVVKIGVIRPAQWTATNPSDGLQTRFVTPGDELENIDFFIKPPTGTGTGSANAPGILLGSVFEDVNGNGVRNTNERGAAGFTVYLDANNSSTLDVGETSTVTSEFGSFVFTEVPPGPHTVRIVAASPVVQTSPGGGAGRVVNLPGGGTISNLTFGVQDLAILDFGDLPASYDLRPVAGGAPVFDPARHVKGAYWMGATIDGEIAGAPNAAANGDDNAGFDDEDGFAFGAVQAGSTWQLTVTSNTFTSYLQGWADWNNDGDFLDVGERIITDKLMSAGANPMSVNVPIGAAGNVYFRFRLGEHSHDPVTGAARNTDTPFGRALTGEVEDYLLSVTASAAAVVTGMPADFDQDNDVDGSDFLRWQRNLGVTSGAGQAQGSANGDGDVDSGDLGAWQTQYGETFSASAGGGAAAANVVAGPRSHANLRGGSLAADALTTFKLGDDSNAFVAALSSASPTSAATSE